MLQFMQSFKWNWRLDNETNIYNSIPIGTFVKYICLKKCKIIFRKASIECIKGIKLELIY